MFKNIPYTCTYSALSIIKVMQMSFIIIVHCMTLVATNIGTVHVYLATPDAKRLHSVCVCELTSAPALGKPKMNKVYCVFCLMKIL